MDEQGLEDAAILLMSLGEEEAAEVFKHLAPKEVQRLGETIAKMKAVPRKSRVTFYYLLAEATGTLAKLA
mgnify:CR=1 FL=1